MHAAQNQRPYVPRPLCTSRTIAMALFSIDAMARGVSRLQQGHQECFYSFQGSFFAHGTRIKATHENFAFFLYTHGTYEIYENLHRTKVSRYTVFFGVAKELILQKLSVQNIFNIMISGTVWFTFAYQIISNGCFPAGTINMVW